MGIWHFNTGVNSASCRFLHFGISFISWHLKLLLVLTEWQECSWYMLCYIFCLQPLEKTHLSKLFSCRLQGVMKTVHSPHFTHMWKFDDTYSRLQTLISAHAWLLVSRENICHSVCQECRFEPAGQRWHCLYTWENVCGRRRQMTKRVSAYSQSSPLDITFSQSCAPGHSCQIYCVRSWMNSFDWHVNSRVS